MAKFRRSEVKESSSEPVPFSIRLARPWLGVIHVACAILFFTNLTRNPYYTQIALLNIGIAVAIFLWVVATLSTGTWKIPRLPFEWPLIALLVVALISSVLAWHDYVFLRSGIFYETTRVWMFTLVNVLMVIYLPGFFSDPLGEDEPPLSIWSDIILSLLWGAMWLGFHTMKDPDPRLTMWDAYGGILWLLAIVYAAVRTRRGRAIEYFHIIFSISLVASVYGILQYAGRDFIWTSPIQPYGGRPVSTFGNPNFLSSYVMMVSPLAFTFGLAVSGRERIGYFVLALINALGVLCTLTRSSYVGLLASYVMIGILLIRWDDKVLVRRVAIAVGVFVALVLLFPKTPVTNAQSPLARFTEIYTALKSGQSYGPWHQRILIWSSAWDMVHQNKLFGKGWGCFELFYPFFQGRLMLTREFAQWRTHANNAHNILLEIWSQTGFFGIGMALLMAATIVAGGWIVVRRKTSGVGRFVTAGLLAAIVGMVVDNFFGNVSIFFAVPAFLFWWYVGGLFNESRTINFTSIPVSRFLGRGLLLIIGAFPILSCVYYVKRWNQEANYFLGFKASKMDDVQTSIKALEKAYGWFAGEVNSNYEMGNSYSRYAKILHDRGLNEESKKFNEKAVGAYSAALSANPGYDEIYFNLGITLAQLGRKEEAARDFEISLFINPILKEVYGSLSNLYIGMGKMEDAIRVLEQAAAVYPQDKDFWNNLGYCYSQVKNPQKSFEAYKKAVSLDVSFEQGWHNLLAAASIVGQKDPILTVPGLVQNMNSAVMQKKYKEALIYAEQIQAILPESPEAHLSVANILFYLGEKEKSEAEFKSTIQINSNFEPAYLNLGRLYFSLGRVDEARVNIQRALQLNPNDPQAKQAWSELPPAL